MFKKFISKIIQIYQNSTGITYRVLMYQKGYVYVCLHLKDNSLEKGYLIRAVIRLFGSAYYKGNLCLVTKTGMIQINRKDVNFIEITDKLYLKEIKIGKNNGYG